MVQGTSKRTADEIILLANHLRVPTTNVPDTINNNSKQIKYKNHDLTTGTIQSTKLEIISKEDIE